MVTTKDLMRASVVGEELIEDGLERGRQEDVQRTRRHVRSLLASRVFGAMDSSWLDSIDDIDRLDNLFDKLLAARDEAQVRAVIVRFRS